jgi:hypothetical protein
METQKESINKAEQLVKELSDMHNFTHTNNFLRKLLRIKDRPEIEVKNELHPFLNQIAQDETGKSALIFANNIIRHVVGREELIGLSLLSTLKYDVKFGTVMNPVVSSDNHSNIPITYPTFFYPETKENLENALKMVVRTAKDIEAEEKSRAAEKMKIIEARTIYG